MQRFLEFYLGNESYAVDLMKVKEVLTPPDLTPIPKSPTYVCGLMNLRGLVLTVIDLRKKFNISPNKETSENAVIIFDIDDRKIGVMVDSIERVLNVSEDKIKPIPAAEAKVAMNFLGVIQQENKLTMWIDLDGCLDSHSSQNKAA